MVQSREAGQTVDISIPETLEVIHNSSPSIFILRQSVFGAFRFFVDRFINQARAFSPAPCRFHFRRGVFYSSESGKTSGLVRHVPPEQSRLKANSRQEKDIVYLRLFFNGGYLTRPIDTIYSMGRII